MVRMLEAPLVATFPFMCLAFAGGVNAQVDAVGDTSALVQSAAVALNAQWPQKWPQQWPQMPQQQPPRPPQQATVGDNPSSSISGMPQPAPPQAAHVPDMKAAKFLWDGLMNQIKASAAQHNTESANADKQNAVQALNKLDGTFSDWQKEQPRSLHAAIQPAAQQPAKQQAAFSLTALQPLIQQWQAKQAQDFGKLAQGWLQSLGKKAPVPFAPSTEGAWKTHLEKMAGEQLRLLGAQVQKSIEQHQGWPKQPNKVLDGMMDAVNSYTLKNWKPMIDHFKNWFEKSFAIFIPKKQAVNTTQALKFVGDVIRGVQFAKAKIGEALPTDVNWLHRMDKQGWKTSAVAKKSGGAGDFYLGGQVKGELDKTGASVFGGAFGKDGSAASMSVGSVFSPGKTPFVVASHFAAPARRQHEAAGGKGVVELKKLAAASGAQQLKAGVEAFATGAALQRAVDDVPLDAHKNGKASQMSFARQREKMLADALKHGASFLFHPKASIKHRASQIWSQMDPKAKTFLTNHRDGLTKAIVQSRQLFNNAQKVAAEKAKRWGPKALQAIISGAKSGWAAEGQRLLKQKSMQAAAPQQTKAQRDYAAWTAYAAQQAKAQKDKAAYAAYAAHQGKTSPSSKYAQWLEAQKRLGARAYNTQPEQKWKDSQKELGERLFRYMTEQGKRLNAYKTGKAVEASPAEQAERYREAAAKERAAKEKYQAWMSAEGKKAEAQREMAKERYMAYQAKQVEKSRQKQASASKAEETAKHEEPFAEKYDRFKRWVEDPVKPWKELQGKLGGDLLRAAMHLPPKGGQAAHLVATQPMNASEQAVQLTEAHPAKYMAKAEEPAEAAESAKEEKTDGMQDLFNGMFGQDAPFWGTVASALAAAANAAQSDSS